MPHITSHRVSGVNSLPFPPMSVPRPNPSLPYPSWFSFLTAIPPPPSPREIKDFVLGGRDSTEPLDPYRREVREGQVQWCLAVLLLVIASVLLVVILVEEASEQPTGSQMLTTHYPLLPNSSAPVLAKWLPINSSAELSTVANKALSEQLDEQNDSSSSNRSYTNSVGASMNEAP
ncbi:hypothetical protein CLOM_g22041 [Closterium sp. NIES-68]|nr:hypothetical protein CLOM_g22041 [Closterium sp. NIES-68]GJP77775.1 hypothetical protein CLOP_g8121 [Closterium sp. NIES-67]